MASKNSGSCGTERNLIRVLHRDKGYFGGGVASANGSVRKIFYEYSPADDDFTIGTPETSIRDLKIWPNPGKGDRITIEGDILSGAGIQIRAFDLTGRAIAIEQIQLQQGRALITFDRLAAGTYTLIVQDQDRSQSARFIIQ